MTKCDVSRCRKDSEITYEDTNHNRVELCDKHYKEWCDKRILFINKKLGVLMMVHIKDDVYKPFLLAIPKKKKVEVMMDG
jgi:hypothetical protein